MELLLRILFFTSCFVIVWAMVGYPLSVRLIGKLYKDRQLKRDYSYQPTVTVMVVAHNEEKVILEKLHNILELDYPQYKIEYLIASDNSTDKTNEIVRQFIEEHKDKKIKLFEVIARKGKTNAQNEARRTVTTEYLVMTDANSMMDKNSIKELMASFTSNDIAYVSGRMTIINKEVSYVSRSEASYWERELAIREIEGRIQTITAGNGAIYACRTIDYHDFNPIQCHDSAMPLFYALQGKRAVCNHDAVAYEKAGEVIEDEFGRKVRMNREILKGILPSIHILHIFRYKWFTYFYIGHRTCRYSLWLSHLVLFVTSAFLVPQSWFFVLVFIGQVLFYLLGLLKVVTKTNNKWFTLIYYYCVTVATQWIGVYNMLTGKSKSFWEKAESTR